MGDFIELGIEGCDKLIDKHFHKIPDRAFHPDHPFQRVGRRVNPKNLSSSHRRKRYEGFQRPPSNSESNSKTGTEKESKKAEPKSQRKPGPKKTRPHLPISPNYSYIPGPLDPPQSNQEPRYFKEVYIPRPPIGAPIGQELVPVPPGLARARMEYGENMAKARRAFDEESYYSESQQPPPRRPKAISRRSSSQPPQLDCRRRHNSPDYSQRSSKKGPILKTDFTKDKVHQYGLKDETVRRFSVTPGAITGSVVGAMVGGWATNKAQTASGLDQHDGRKRDVAGNRAITLLGAALGGLAVNAAIGKIKKSKQETEEKGGQWGDEFGQGGGEQGPPNERQSGRREERSGRRRMGNEDPERSDGDDRSSYTIGSGKGSGWRIREYERGNKDERENRRYRVYGDNY